MKTYPYAMNAHSGAKLGLIVLQADETIEGDFRRIFPAKDVAIYTSRVPSGAVLNRETIA